MATGEYQGLVCQWAHGKFTWARVVVGNHDAVAVLDAGS
jgi:hypothetical protein